MGIDKDRVRATFLALRPFDATVSARTPFVATAVPVTRRGIPKSRPHGEGLCPDPAALSAGWTGR